MHLFARNIICGFAALLISLGFSSCVSEDGLKTGADSDASKVFVTLDMRSLSTALSQNQGVEERVKSLRIIVLNDRTIDNISYIGDGSEGFQEGLASTFEYLQVFKIPEGYKRIFVIANQESIGELSYQITAEERAEIETEIGQTLPTNLDALLGLFEEGDNSEILGKLLNTIYFAPDYTIEGKTEGGTGGSDGSVEPSVKGTVYLPYTAQYNLMITNVKEWSQTIYLVPVATKFIFNFTNNREAPVKVNRISVENTNNQNFLMGQVGESDYYKYFETTSYYWIDWLAKVAEESQKDISYGTNVNINEKYGWIGDYSLPTSSVLSEKFFVSTTIGNNFAIPGGTKETQTGEDGEEVEVINGGTYIAGPYYATESMNLVDPEEGSTSPDPYQAYYLTIEFEDTAEGEEAPEFSHVAIDNLQALFRNTYVIISFKLNKGDIEVYAQINPWNQKSANGWVTEGTRPNLMPRKR